MKTLGEFRREKKLTQVKFAELLSIRPDTVAKLENKPIDDLDGKKIKNLATTFGMTTDEVLQHEKPVMVPLKTDDKFTAVKGFETELNDRIKRGLSDNDSKEIKSYKVILENSIKKPRIAVFGRSGVGKSTLINAIIGEEKLPFFWKPTTAIIIIVKHISDRAKSKSSECIILRKDKDSKFNINVLDNAEKINDLCIEEGSIELLKQYGTKNGRERCKKKGIEEAIAAILYIDSDILLNVDFVDLPGIQTEGNHEVTGANIVNTLIYSDHAYDAAIFMSHANAFFRNEGDIEMLMSVIEHLPWFEKKGVNGIKPLGNLFIIASQAHTAYDGNKASLEAIFKEVCENLKKLMPKGENVYFKDRSVFSGYSVEEYLGGLKRRFFTYSTNDKTMRKGLEESLVSLSESIPLIILDKVREELCIFARTNNDMLIDDEEYLKDFLDNPEKKYIALEQIIVREDARIADNEKHQIKIKEKIERFKRRSISAFKDKYSIIMTENFILQTIQDRGFKKKKKDMELLGSHIGAALEDELHSILNSYSEDIRELTDEYIEEFEAGIKVCVEIPFNTTRAFATGLAGAAVYGGLAFWVSTIASNLGAYILVAKGVSLLSAFGISLSKGTATAIAFVSSIGGPAVLGIAIAGMASVAAFVAFSGGWEKRVAKKLINAYEEYSDGNAKGVMEIYKNGIVQFWEDTETAFRSGANEMENEWQEYIGTLTDLVNKSKNGHIGDIDEILKQKKKLREFFTEESRLLSNNNSEG